MARNKHFHSKREEEDRNKRSDQSKSKGSRENTNPESHVCYQGLQGPCGLV